jgi:hypothetical protein
MLRRLACAIVLVGLLSGMAHAQSAPAAPPPLTAPPAVLPLDQEMWAGVSYRQALFGVAVLGGGGVVVAWLTGSTIAGISAAVAVAAAYVVYDPGVTGVVSPDDLPSLSDLGVRGSQQQQ